MSIVINIEHLMQTRTKYSSKNMQKHHSRLIKTHSSVNVCAIHMIQYWYILPKTEMSQKTSWTLTLSNPAAHQGRALFVKLSELAKQKRIISTELHCKSEPYLLPCMHNDKWLQ